MLLPAPHPEGTEPRQDFVGPRHATLLREPVPLARYGMGLAPATDFASAL